MMRAFKIYSLSNSQICNMMLLTVVTKLYITCLLFIYFINWKFEPLNPFHPPCPSLHSPASNLFSLIPCISETTECLSFSVYFTYHNTLKLHSCCCKWQDFFLFYYCIVFHCVCVYALFIHLLNDGHQVVSMSWQLQIMFQWTWRLHISFRIRVFVFFG